MGHRTCLRGNYVASETIGFVDHQSCWTGMRIEGKFESDFREIPDFDSAIQKLVTNELDIAVIPAQLVHGNHMRLLSDGLSVSGALNQNRPFHVVVSSDRLSHLPRSALVISDSRIVRRQLRRFRKDLRVLSPVAWAGICDLDQIPSDECEWMEEMRRDGTIDAYTIPRDVYDRRGLKARRFALWPEPKEPGGSFFLPPIHSDLPLVITRSGYPKTKLRGNIGDEGAAAWHIMSELFSAESEAFTSSVGILVKYRSVSSLLQQAEATRDLTLEQACRDSEGEILQDGTKLLVRIEHVSSDGSRTFRMDRLIDPENIHSSSVTMDREWRSLLSTLSQPQPDHPRWGPGNPAFFEGQ